MSFVLVSFTSYTFKNRTLTAEKGTLWSSTSTLASGRKALARHIPQHWLQAETLYASSCHLEISMSPICLQFTHTHTHLDKNVEVAEKLLWNHVSQTGPRPTPNSLSSLHGFRPLPQSSFHCCLWAPEFHLSRWGRCLHGPQQHEPGAPQPPIYADAPCVLCVGLAHGVFGRMEMTLPSKSSFE